MTEENQQQAAGNQPQFAIQRIYVKDVSFESPMEYGPRPQAQPAISQDLNTVINTVAENLYEVILKLTVTVKLEDKVAFLTEVHQAGLFQVKGLEGPQLQHCLSSTCPSILFPYVRETIDTLVVKGGFPPISLPPINFDAVYAKAVAEAQARAEAEKGEADTH